MAILVTFLQNWMRKYFENRDLYLKTLKEIKATDDGLDVSYKDKQILFLMQPDLDADAFQKIATDQKKHYGIACYNTRENLEKLIKHWKTFAAYPFLSIYFINPFSEGDNKWIIRPHVHERVSEKESLAVGLQSLFEGVTETTLQHIEHMAKKA